MIRLPKTLAKVLVLLALMIPALMNSWALAQEVKLPLAEYEKLRERAQPTPDKPEGPPPPFALEDADFIVQAGGRSAKVLQTLRITLFNDDWHSVPLGEAGSFIDANFGGAEGRVRLSDRGEWSLEIRGAGRHEVKLQSVLLVTRDETATRPTWSLGFTAPRAAVVRGRLEVPAEVVDVTTGNGVLLEKAGAGGQEWRFSAPSGAQVRWLLSGETVVPKRALLPLRFEATTATAATVLHTRFRVLAWVEARVGQGRLETLRIPLPEDLKVTALRGSATWKMDGKTLVVTPYSAVEGALGFEMDLVGEPRQTFKTLALLPEGSSRTTVLGKAVLQGDGLLSLLEAGSARAPSADEARRLPEALRSAGGRLFALSDPARPPSWEATWVERTEVLASQIDRLLVDVVVGTSGRASYQLWAEMRNRGAQHLSLGMPAGFELVEAHRDGQPVVPGAAGGSAGGEAAPAGSLAVPLLTQDVPQIVHLLGFLPFTLPKAEGDFPVPLPALSAPAARVEVRVVLPGGWSYQLADATRAGLVAPPPQSAARLTENSMAKQVAWSPQGDLAAVRLSLMSAPPGYVQVGASWSALSATPSALVIKARQDKESFQWF